MLIIKATWYDDMGQPFIQDFYNSSISPADIFIKYIKNKELFNKRVMAVYDDTVVFDDGSRVILTNEEVLQTLDEPIEVSYDLI